MKRVKNSPMGYELEIPDSFVADDRLASVRMQYGDDTAVLTVTNEDDVYRRAGSVEGYIETLFSCVDKEAYLEKNRVRRLSKRQFSENGLTVFELRLQLLECPADVMGYYTYYVLYDDGARCLQLTFRALDDRDFAAVRQSVRLTEVCGERPTDAPYECMENPDWADETRALYRRIRARERACFGIFTGNYDNPRMMPRLADLEEKLDYRFGVFSDYMEMDWDFPADGVRASYEEGRVVQINYHTSQWTTTNTMGSYTDLLDIYRRKKDDDLRRVARQIAACGVPVLFRVNNEMNSDWTIWSGLNCMIDPDIFTRSWEYIYDVFSEEGANRYLIWIWNPQGFESCPAGDWNEVRTYMPSPRCVQMLGVTSYTFGRTDYWYDFETLHRFDEAYYGKYFGAWPWIIGEFGCSDMHRPSRKAGYIRRMFDCFTAGKFQNIKIAVWFNANDYNADGTVRNLIELDETGETTEAFAAGLKRLVASDPEKGTI